jgi:PKD repeat protein
MAVGPGRVSSVVTTQKEMGMDTNTASFRADRWWGSALITVGLVLFVVVGLTAFAMVRDPGGYYDDWTPSDDVEGPEASYEWTSAGLEVEFADTSEAGKTPIEQWRWDFGDDAVSSQPNPTHRFPEAGEWDVTLDVVDRDGRTSTAEGTVEVEPLGNASGDASIGLADVADKVVRSVDRASKGSVVVVLVVGLFIVLAMIGGRLVRYGVRLLRPDPDKIKVKLRPKELELVVADQTALEQPAEPDVARPNGNTAPVLTDGDREKEPAGV